AFCAEFGWVPGAGTNAKVTDAESVWRQGGARALSVGKPIAPTWDNGEALTSRRTIAVAEKYLFTARGEVTNKAAEPVTLFPYALISRHGTPHTEGYYILHEGLIGVLGDKGLQEETYKKLDDLKPAPDGKREVTFGNVTKTWL